MRSIARALAQGASWGRFDVSLDGRSWMLRVIAAFMNARSRWTSIATGDQGLFVARRTFEAIGGYPPLPLMEDVALSRALRDAAGRPACVRERVVVSGRRWDRDGALATIGAMWSLRYAFWRGADPALLARRYYGVAPRAAATLIVFAKTPLPGRVKTRLAATLGADAAVRVYRDLLERTLDVACTARRAGVVGDVELWVAPEDPPGVLRDWCAARAIELRAQRGDDLGARMRGAVAHALARGRPALVIGSDAPGYDVAYLAAAASALEHNDAVIGPAEDGGYVLIGLARDVDAFSRVPWSTGAVLAATRERLAEARATWHELHALWDVDTHDDFLRWRRETAAPA
jgi:rSAM/selenodomain-associated transferase 1